MRTKEFRSAEETDLVGCRKLVRGAVAPSCTVTVSQRGLLGPSELTLAAAPPPPCMVSRLVSWLDTNARAYLRNQESAFERKVLCSHLEETSMGTRAVRISGGEVTH